MTSLESALESSTISADPIAADLELVKGPAEESVGKAPQRSLARLVLIYVALRSGNGEITGRSPDTIRRRLLDFAACAPDNPRSVRRDHVERWIDRPEYSPNYRQARLSTLHVFCQWCAVHGYMRRDPTAGVPSPKVSEGIPKRLREDEWEALMEVAVEDSRTCLIVLLMLQECLRCAEVAALEVSDIDFAEHTILICGKGGDGQHTAILPITDETWAVMTTYIANQGHRHGPLIRNLRQPGQPLLPASIGCIVRKAMIAAGLTYKGDPTHARTPHSLRHTGAHDILERTHDVRSVQQALRHKSVRSTEIYLRGQVGDLPQTLGGRHYRRLRLIKGERDTK